MNYLIGCGGVGSWLAPVECRLVGPNNLTLVDGDTLEEKNLDRQLFTRDDIGRNKAEALASLYGCDARPEWYAMGRYELTPDDWLLVVVDNHPARLAALQDCDSNGCRALFAANETFSAEAFYYQRSWRGTPLDPRVYYPELLTNHDDDPMAVAAGCTGAAQTQNPQLASANFMAAALLLQLQTIWKFKLKDFGPEAFGFLPYKLISNLTGMEVFRVKDTNNENQK